MIIHILITVVFYFILMFLSTNLLGLFVRSLFSNPEIDRLQSETSSNILKDEIKKMQYAYKGINITALILIITYLYLLFHFWNIGVMAVAVIIMIGRLPDLVWEIKHGKKIDIKSAPNNVLTFITTFLIWAALPVLYYFIYH